MNDENVNLLGSNNVVQIHKGDFTVKKSFNSETTRQSEPKLCFELVKNTDDIPQLDKSEYDIHCCNDGRDPIRLKKISLVCGQNTIYSREIPNAAEFVIPAHGFKKHKISSYELKNIEKYYERDKNATYKILVNTCEGEYSYNFSLTEFDDEWRSTIRAIKVVTGR